jgi:hypothetical protein
MNMIRALVIASGIILAATYSSQGGEVRYSYKACGKRLLSDPSAMPYCYTENGRVLVKSGRATATYAQSGPNFSVPNGLYADSMVSVSPGTITISNVKTINLSVAGNNCQLAVSDPGNSATGTCRIVSALDTPTASGSARQSNDSSAGDATAANCPDFKVRPPRGKYGSYKAALYNRCDFEIVVHVGSCGHNEPCKVEPVEVGRRSRVAFDLESYKKPPRIVTVSPR